ncbi:MAG: hypothetical protein DRI77_08540 [Chloroflexi bacterium]|nr:MAG: hypothetical protein DRI77_08540 [Chloroflexota bacterium]
MNVMDSISPSIEPVVGALRVIGGVSLGADLCTAVLPSPPRAARGRENERLFILLDLGGQASSHLYRELRQVLTQTYWATAGSVTAALRQAAAAASRHLFRANLHSDPSDRCYGSIVCAVLHGEDLFILQSGPAQPCALRGDLLECFCDEELPRLGVGPMTDARLYHTLVAVGDTMLLASPALLLEASSDALTRVLNRADVQDVTAGLEQIGAGADFTALVARWTAPSESPQAKAPAIRRPAPPPPNPEPQPRPQPAPRAGPSLGERVGPVISKTGRGMGRGIVRAGGWLASSTGALFKRMLPGREREARRRARTPRPVPQENRVVMATIAILIPVLIAVVVALAYGSFGRDARLQRLVKRAREEIALAEDAEGVVDEARPHWEAALTYASDAVEWRPDDSEIIALQAQAQAALDVLDGVVRLNPIHLMDLGSGAVTRRLIAHGQTIFVLDPAGGWVIQLTLNQLGDGVIEQDVPLSLVHTGQQVGGKEVGQLVDFAWMNPGGERQTSGLVILEDGGALISYDPAWGDAEGGANLARSLLGTPPTEAARVIDSFNGRLYILDPGDDDQIWRYEPRGDVYPDQPDRYFVTSPPKPLGDALDMAIDGNIYILYADGTILKFLQGEPQPFEVRGVPDGIGQAVAFDVDRDSRSETVYVADRGAGRIIELDPDGAFRAQFCVAGGVFDELESLAVDEMAGRLYIISGGRLYTALLP